MNTTELKALAEKVLAWGLTATRQPEGEEFAGIAAVGALDEDGEFYGVAVIDTDQYADFSAAKKIADFFAAANPAAILELIAAHEDAQGEIQALRATEQNLRERVKALEEALFAAMYWDNGTSEFEKARALLEQKP